MSRQPSWEAIAHRLADRVFLGDCPHVGAEPDPNCPFCADAEAVAAYRDKCRQTGRRYAGQDFEEKLAAAPTVSVAELSRQRSSLTAAEAICLAAELEKHRSDTLLVAARIEDFPNHWFVTQIDADGVPLAGGFAFVVDESSRSVTVVPGSRPPRTNLSELTGWSAD